MALPKSLTTVTTFSKTLAAFLFITLPIIAFFAGMEYQREIESQTERPNFKNMIDSFEECVADGNPVMESHPRQCMTDEGKRFVEEASVPSTQVPPDEPVFCTQDAKLCPDGSYVGREGPNCEFASCPTQ